MSGQIIPFNPLDKKNLGASVAEALLRGKPQPLGNLPEFLGAGIYAIYYIGNFPAYAELSKRNKDGKLTAPIYVGKAVPSGARKGISQSPKSVGKPLYKRLLEHAESIRSVPNLRVDDFFCRFLVVDDIWIPLGEALIIARYSPIWNNKVEGFGNHDPGSGRYNGMCPRWDVLHPGRSWAAKCKPRGETAEQIAGEIEADLRLTPPISDKFVFPEE